MFYHHSPVGWRGECKSLLPNFTTFRLMPITGDNWDLLYVYHSFMCLCKARELSSTTRLWAATEIIIPKKPLKPLNETLFKLRERNRNLMIGVEYAPDREAVL